MKTVQVALRDFVQARSLRDLLLGDGLHQVHLVEHPNLVMAGVIVMDAAELSRVSPSGSERLVVVASKQYSDLAKIWEAGVRHVVFYGDAPRTVRVSVLATELMIQFA